MSQKRKRGLQRGLSEIVEKQTAPIEDKSKLSRGLIDRFTEPHAEEASAVEGQSIPTATPSAIPSGIPRGIPASRKKSAPAEEESPAELELTAPLDATHTSSEKSVYSIMYRETISKGVAERHFGPAELMKKSGIRSRNTVHKALYGLLEKLSVEIVSETRGNPIGPRYRLYRPLEIERRRKAAGIKIDPQTKKITERGGIPASIPAGSPPAIAKNWDTSSPETGTATIPNIGTLYKREENIDVESLHPSSSSKSKALSLSDSDDDHAFLESIKEVYERATGSTWTTADAITAQRGRDIPAEIWGIAICFCVDRAPNHRFERLAYVLGQAREHAETMKGFSRPELLAILRHSLGTLERARATGKWTLSEIESEESKEAEK